MVKQRFAKFRSHIIHIVVYRWSHLIISRFALWFIWSHIRFSCSCYGFFHLDDECFIFLLHFHHLLLLLPVRLFEILDCLTETFLFFNGSIASLELSGFTLDRRTNLEWLYTSLFGNRILDNWAYINAHRVTLIAIIHFKRAVDQPVPC